MRWEAACGQAKTDLEKAFFEFICNREDCPIWQDCQRYDWRMCLFLEKLKEASGAKHGEGLDDPE